MTKPQRLQLESVLKELEIELMRVELEMDEVRLLLKRETRRDRVHRTERRCTRQIRRIRGNLVLMQQALPVGQDTESD